MAAGVFENFSGGFIARQLPSLGCSRNSKKPTAARCGSVEHFVERVGAHDGDAVLLAELHPFLGRVRGRRFAQHLVIDLTLSLFRPKPLRSDPQLWLSRMPPSSKKCVRPPLRLTG